MREENSIRRVQSKTAKKVRKVNDFLASGNSRSRKDAFLEAFMLCEVSCKSIMEGYFDLNPKKDPRKDNKDIKLEINRIRPALKAMGYFYDEYLIASIFGSSKTRNAKSCKKLRDGIVHSLSIEDIREVIYRNEALHRDMNAFIHMVNTRPLANEKTKQKKRTKNVSRQRAA